MDLRGIGNQQSINPLGPENKPSGIKNRLMNFLKEKLGASKNESPVLEITRNETKATATPPQTDKATQRTSSIAKQALPASVKKEDDEGETFIMQYDGKTRILNTNDTGTFKTTTPKGTTLQYQQLPKEPESTEARPRSTPNQIKMQEQIAAARNSPAQQALRNASSPAPKANTHKLGQFEGTYKAPPAPPMDKSSNRKTTYGELRSDEKIPPKPVPRPTPEQVAEAAKKTAGGPDDVAPKKKAKPLPTPPQPKLGQFGGSYKAPPPPPPGVDPFKGG